MNAKEFLRQAYRLDQKVKSSLAELEYLRKTASGIRSPGFEENHNPNRPTEAPFVISLEKIWAMEERLNTEIDRLVELKQQIRDVIDGVENTDEMMVLRYRYILYYSWEDIAAEMNFGLRWVHVIHGRALASADAVMKKRGSECKQDTKMHINSL